MGSNGGMAGNFEGASSPPTLANISSLEYAKPRIHMHSAESGHIGRARYPLSWLNLPILRHLNDMYVLQPYVPIQINAQLSYGQSISSRNGISLAWKHTTD